MISPDYCQLMARYNRWMNERLYALLSGLPDDERKRDRGAFFGSMHGTLNHLLWGDRMWLGRFLDEPCSHPAFGVAHGPPNALDAPKPTSSSRTISTFGAPGSANSPTGRCSTGRVAIRPNGSTRHSLT